MSILGASPNAPYFFPDGSSVSYVAATMLGTAHPDNPYVGTAARLMYNPIYEFGPGAFSARAHSERYLLGVKGVASGWDYDTAVLFSQSRQSDTAEKMINRLVSNALLNPTAANVPQRPARPTPRCPLEPSGASARTPLNLPAIWRAARGPGRARLRAQRGMTSGARQPARTGVSVALGAEYRRGEQPARVRRPGQLPPVLPLTTYAGSRGVFRRYVETLLPIVAQLEANAALRYDHIPMPARHRRPGWP
jgi:iron complex outermembrane receptor protein